ncbi:MAG: hypothetical protein HY925_04275 [Elusimicrobia bacterium]|nr:hypothetical protein [Elusimicrobiota bacterium]
MKKLLMLCLVACAANSAHAQLVAPAAQGLLNKFAGSAGSFGGVAGAVPAAVVAVKDVTPVADQLQFRGGGGPGHHGGNHGYVQRYQSGTYYNEWQARREMQHMARRLEYSGNRIVSAYVDSWGYGRNRSYYFVIQYTGNSRRW